MQRRIASQLGRTYQVSNLFTELTVQENLFLASWQTRKKKTSLIADAVSFMAKIGNQRQHVAEIARRVGLGDKLDVTVAELSHGAHRQLELGITLATNPGYCCWTSPWQGFPRLNGDS